MAILDRQLGVTASQQAVAKFQSAGGAQGGATRPNGAINLDNVLTLIPGEVVPLYIAGSGIVVSPVFGIEWRAIVFWICFVACGILRFVASKPANAQGIFEGANGRLVGVSLIAFFLWAHAVSAQGPLVTSLPAAAWGFFAMVLGVLAPLFVPAK